MRHSGHLIDSGEPYGQVWECDIDCPHPDHVLAQHVEGLVKAQAAEAEDLLAQAIVAQDYDHLDDLTVVYQDGHAPAVASMLPPTAYESYLREWVGAVAELADRAGVPQHFAFRWLP